MPRRRAKKDELRRDWIESRRGLILNEQWLAKQYAQARADYHGKPQAIWKHWSRESWIVDDGARRPEEYNFLTSVAPKSNPKKGRMPRKKKPTRAKPRSRNTHDPRISANVFKGLVESAERELAEASEALDKLTDAKTQKARDRLNARSIKHLIRTGAYIGAAERELIYAQGLEDRRWRSRLAALVDQMPEWGKNFVDAQS